MNISPSFEKRGGNIESYSGIVQSTNDTCLFASIAGAVNHVTNQQICTEQSLHKAFLTANEHNVTFGSVAKYVPNSLIQTQEFHDKDSPLREFEEIMESLQAGAVVILSLQYADISNGNVKRANLWHMLSVFRNRNGDLQVWDTSGRSGFFTNEDFKQLVCDSLAFEYKNRHLVSHEDHHVLVIHKQ